MSGRRYGDLKKATAKVKRPKRPDELVGAAALAAARALATGGFTSYDAVRSTTLRGFAAQFARTYGMPAPEVDDELGWVNPASRRAFVDAVCSLDYSVTTPDHYGHVHEQLTGWTLHRGEIIPSGERRRGGVHFTPQDIAERMVRRTLEPLLALLSPEQTLGLHVCDPCVGGGAFLLEVVRQLGQRLVDGRIERDILVAKRLVAMHCVYGVDRCRWAVATAKIALWLECRATSMPPTWLDHNIRVGDSLVGLNDKQIARFHWKEDAEIAEVPELRALVDSAMLLGDTVRKLRLEDLSKAARGAA